MARARTAQVLVSRSGRGAAPDRLIVEEPLEILLDGRLTATTMRTPGNDFELAVGFLHGDGALGGAAVHQVRYCATGSALDTAFNVVDVDTRGAAPGSPPRLGAVGSSCGVCGSRSVDQLVERLPPFAEPRPVAPAVVGSLPGEVAARQELFAATGSVHAAATFDPATGAVDVVREDIGRHNAVDKVVGRLLLDARLPATGAGLFVSGRASFEMVQKAWAGGFGVVVAVSGPSALAVATARRANITLVGFVRGDSMNVYSPAPL